jgi:dTDP-4-amino-4,6-dideoxygalactose transaminase
LKKRYDIYLSPPHMSGDERGLLLEAFDSNWVAPLGPHVDAFEDEMCKVLGVKAAAATSSGTAALHLALLLAGVREGDRVLCSTFTFSATANAIVYCGAEPVFIDCDATWNIDPALVEEEIYESARRGRLPKAIIPVDLYGQPADFDRINSAAAAAGVEVIEDAAEALGSTYKSKPAGSLARIGILSFNGNKIITTSGGGMLVSDDEELVRRARFLATQARDPGPHYQHSAIGYNYRISNLLAAVGRGQLRTLKERVSTRRRIFERYRSELGELPGFDFMPEAAYARMNRWLTCVTIDPERAGITREDVRLALEAEKIEARPVWKPMHQQPIFAGRRVLGGAVSAALFANGLCLPSGSSLSEDDQTRVIDLIAAVAAKPAVRR